MRFKFTETRLYCLYHALPPGYHQREPRNPSSYYCPHAQRGPSRWRHNMWGGAPSLSAKSHKARAVAAESNDCGALELLTPHYPVTSITPNSLRGKPPNETLDNLLQVIFRITFPKQPEFSLLWRGRSSHPLGKISLYQPTSRPRVIRL